MTRKKDSVLKTVWKYRVRYAFLIPALFLVFSIKYYNFAIAVIKSFYNWNALNYNVFIGVENYSELFGDPRVIQSFENVLIIALSMVVINLVMPLMAAELVYHIKARGFQNFLKTGFIVPMVVPGMVTILMWRWIYSGNMGVLNQFLSQIGLGGLRHNWLAETTTALPSLIFVGFPWIAGLPFLLYLAGLMNIPSEILESAQLDGVTSAVRLWRIDIPMLFSQIKLVVVYVLIQAFQSFEISYALTGGGPGYTTNVPTLVIYDQAFNHSRFGYSSAIGVVLFVLVLVLTLINQRYIKDSEKID